MRPPFFRYPGDAGAARSRGAGIALARAVPGPGQHYFSRFLAGGESRE